MVTGVWPGSGEGDLGLAVCSPESNEATPMSQ